MAAYPLCIIVVSFPHVLDIQLVVERRGTLCEDSVVLQHATFFAEI